MHELNLQFPTVHFELKNPEFGIYKKRVMNFDSLIVI